MVCFAIVACPDPALRPLIAEAKSRNSRQFLPKLNKSAEFREFASAISGRSVGSGHATIAKHTISKTSDFLWFRKKRINVLHSPSSHLIWEWIILFYWMTTVSYKNLEIFDEHVRWLTFWCLPLFSINPDVRKCKVEGVKKEILFSKYQSKDMKNEFLLKFWYI